MIKIDFNNISGSPVEKQSILEIVRETVEKSEIFGSEKKNISLSFAVVGFEEIKKLNKAYRNKNFPTDVLSFAEYKNSQEIKNDKTKDMFLGEIILCYNDIADYCRKNKLDIKKETAKVISHGVLHLLGFRHGKKMFKIQDEICSIKFKINKINESH